MKQLVLPPGSRSGDRVELREREHHYLARVRRVAVGEQLAALDGDRRLVLEVNEITSDRTTLRVVEDLNAPEAPATRIVLFPFLLKSGKLDDVIRQAGEAGVSAVVPVVGDHCIARSGDDGAKKAQRWATIAKEAAQQSGNARVCEVHSPIASRTIPSLWDEEGPLFFFHQTPLSPGSLHRTLSPKPRAVGIIVGPEGGLSAAEVAWLQTHHAQPIWLGPFVLRAETASLYAVAAVNIILQESSEWTTPS